MEWCVNHSVSQHFIEFKSLYVQTIFLVSLFNKKKTFKWNLNAYISKSSFRSMLANIDDLKVDIYMNWKTQYSFYSIGLAVVSLVGGFLNKMHVIKGLKCIG